MGKTAEELGKEREKRVKDALELRVPDRVPLVTLFGAPGLDQANRMIS